MHRMERFTHLAGGKRQLHCLQTDKTKQTLLHMALECHTKTNLEQLIDDAMTSTSLDVLAIADQAGNTPVHLTCHTSSVISMAISARRFELFLA